MGAADWRRQAIKPLVFILSLIPVALLGLDALTGNLGANPIESITHGTGLWALRILLISLAVTPIHSITGWSGLLRIRRMLGLFAFFYALLHFATYLVFDHLFDIGAIIEDIVKRPYITLGFTAFLLLIPLAVTSTNRMFQRLGSTRWRRLHRLAYVAATLSVLHYLWLAKADHRDPLIYGAVLFLLLSYRVWHRRRSAVRPIVPNA